MRNTIIIGTSVLTLLLATTGAQAQTTDCRNQGTMGSSEQVVGTLLGAAVGGLLGSQVGGGTGNKIAIGAGVLGGGLLGHSVGSTLGCADQAQHGAAAQKAFETQPAGTTTSWQNPDANTAGSVTPQRAFGDL